MRTLFFYYQRKVHMTLFETLIALSLLAILLVTVFSLLRQLSAITQSTESTQKQSFQMRYLESRLSFVFQRIVNENENANGRIFYFYTLSPQDRVSRLPSLVLTFNNEIRLDPLFAGDVLSRLYVNLEGRLCLAIWPLHGSDPHSSLQEEVLLEHVVHLDYAFYFPPEQIVKSKDITKKDIDPHEPARDQWHTEWLEEYKQMPVIMKMNIHIAENAEDFKQSMRGIKVKTKDVILQFVLPSSKNPIQYPL